MKTPDLKMLEYMRHFKCTGTECEDLCCIGWHVHLSEADYHHLQEAAEISPFVKEQIKAVVKTESTDVSPDVPPDEDPPFAILDNNHNHCTFMRVGLCAVHQDVGENFIPRTCATFPRVVMAFSENTRLSGSFSCPEVTRNCLQGDNPMDEVTAPAGILPLGTKVINALGLKDNYFDRDIHLVREFIKTLFTKDLPISDKMFILVYMGRQLDSFFTRATIIDPQIRLNATLARLAKKSYQSRILQTMDRAEKGSDLAWQFIQQVLCISLKKTGHQRYNTLAHKILAGYDLTSTSAETAPFSQISTTYFSNHDVVMKRFGDTINRYLLLYCHNTFYQSSLYGLNSISNLTCRFVLCFVCIRFMFFSHPAIVLLASESGGSEQERLTRLAAFGVEIIQSFSRTVGSNVSLLQSMTSNMKDLGLSQVGEMASLLKM